MAADPDHFSLLRHEFPHVQLLALPGYRLRFALKRSLTILKIIFQIPKILRAVRREHRWLQAVTKRYKIDAIISDNRYGLYHAAIPAVFITHQLLIKTPFGTLTDNLIQRLHYRLIRRFSACWIPDYAGTVNLAGELSHPGKLPPLPVKYLGRLSRFNDFGHAVQVPLLILLSGPEPQRTVFEEILLRQLATDHFMVILVRGLPQADQVLSVTNPNIVVYNHLPAEQLHSAINKAGVVVSRSGYSTVLDLIGRNKKCIFVPTPGQSEQEYLAKYLSASRLCVSYRQSDFDLRAAVVAAEALEVQPFSVPEGDFREVVDDFLQHHLKQPARD